MRGPWSIAHDVPRPPDSPKGLGVDRREDSGIPACRGVARAEAGWNFGSFLGPIQFLPQNIEARVAAQQPHLGIHQQRRDAMRDDLDGPVQCLERPILVAERRIRQGLPVRFDECGRELLDFGPAADPDVGMGQPPLSILADRLNLSTTPEPPTFFPRNSGPSRVTDPETPIPGRVRARASRG